MNKNKFKSLFTITTSVLLFSCSSDIDIATELENSLVDEAKTCELIFNVTRRGFDDQSETRSAEAWQNNDIIYLIFPGDSNYGEAIYNNGKWTITYYGSISQSSGTCLAVYIEKSVGETGSMINLDENSIIYEASEATFVFEGGSLSISAILTPKIGRIRFEGASNVSFKLYGISVFTGFNTSTGSFILSPALLISSVNGSTSPYIYGVFNDNDEPRVNVIYSDIAFTKAFPTNVFQPGQSGYVTLPTFEAHTGWRNHALLKVKGVEFAMIPVEYSEGNFLLAETETTEELFYAILDSNRTSQLPVFALSIPQYNNFMIKLNQATNLSFRFPSMKEWQFAYKGGNKSQGYIYSGSNDIYEVAWFTGNANYSRHAVKQLKPNELGFYDMSGNVYEYTSEQYSGSENYAFGGYYNSSASNCLVDSETSSSNYTGLRLAISND